MVDTIVDGFANGIVETHTIRLILFCTVYEETVFSNRLTVIEKFVILLVCDVDDVAYELEVRAIFTEKIRESK